MSALPLQHHLKYWYQELTSSSIQQTKVLCYQPMRDSMRVSNHPWRKCSTSSHLSLVSILSTKMALSIQTTTTSCHRIIRSSISACSSCHLLCLTVTPASLEESLTWSFLETIRSTHRGDAKMDTSQTSSTSNRILQFLLTQERRQGLEAQQRWSSLL